mgnify:FL=1
MSDKRKPGAQPGNRHAAKANGSDYPERLLLYLPAGTKATLEQRAGRGNVSAWVRALLEHAMTSGSEDRTERIVPANGAPDVADPLRVTA